MLSGPKVNPYFGQIGGAWRRRANWRRPALATTLGHAQESKLLKSEFARPKEYWSVAAS
jgi:hypothetical protein